MRNQLRASLLLDGVARLVLAGSLFVGVQLTLDWFIRWSWELRASILAAAVVGATVTFWRWVIAPLRIPLALAAVAGLIERRHPKLNCLLVSAVQFEGGRVGAAECNAPGLVAAAMNQARAACADLDFAAILNRTALRRSVVLLALCAAAFSTAFAARPEIMGVWLDRNILLGTSTWPKRTQLVVDLPGGVLHGARGDDLTITATVNGLVPRQIDVVTSAADGSSTRRAMVRVGERGFRHIFESVETDFRFHLEGGDDRTATWRTQLVDRPRVENASVTVTPPTYAAIEPFTLPEGRSSVAALWGSELQIEFDVNKPIRRALLVSQGESVADAKVDDLHGLLRWVPTSSAVATLILVDDNELENRKPPTFAVRLTHDEPPAVGLSISGVGELVTPQARLPLEIRFEDDYGLAEAELVYTIWGGEEGEQVRAVPGFQPGIKQHVVDWEVPVASFGLTAGAGLTLMARAVDFDDLQGPNVGTSTSIVLRVVDSEVLMAELARREQEARRALEHAIDLQEQLRRDLLDLLHAATSNESSSDSEPGGWSRIPSRQEQIAGRIQGVLHEIERIISELHYNDLLTPATRQRLRNGVAQPLTLLTERQLPATIEQLRHLARDRSTIDGSRIDSDQGEILGVLHAVLADMLKWEGLQQAVGMLRDIIRLQEELNEATEAERQRRADEIFGNDPE